MIFRVSFALRRSQGIYMTSVGDGMFEPLCMSTFTTRRYDFQGIICIQVTEHLHVIDRKWNVSALIAMYEHIYSKEE